MRQLLLALVLAGLLAGCSTGAPPRGGTTVVAAEDVWASVARDVAGPAVKVRSLVADPATNPHDYEPTAADARAFARARVVIVNGLGYDSWADDLLAATRTSDRVVVNVGDVLGLRAGDNPHQWYSPASVTKVATAVEAALRRALPSQTPTSGAGALASYRAAFDAARGAYAGRTIGATESIAEPLAQALGLRVATPASFLAAVSEGIEPTAADKATVDRQVRAGAIDVLVYNRQNATPDVQRIVERAAAANIPVVAVTETITPKGTSFQAWQLRQLEALGAALDGRRA